MRISDWISDVCSSDLVIDDNTNTVTLGTVSVPEYLKPNFVGQLVKVEIITTETLTIYRVFWTDPTGDSPDYVTSESNVGRDPLLTATIRSEEHTSELQSLMRISYAVFCLKKKKK